MAQEELFEGVNQPKDPKNLTDLEKKHLPVIDCPNSAKKGQKFTVTIEVGKLAPHPNEHEHHIDFIDLYEDRLYLSRWDFAAVQVHPKVTCEIALGKSGKLRAFSSCNLHGVWESSKDVSIT